MDDEKTHLLKQLDEARAYLWSVVAALEPSDKLNPQWNKRDFFAHIAGWEALVFQVFRDYVAGISDQSYPFTSVDDANRNFVQTRQSLTADDARLECEINRFAIRTLLQNIPAADYHTPIPFPWGSNTIAEFIQGAVEHELDHASSIVKMTRTNPLY
ncbi:MAG: ClbS/DfsB family four-helix bundle protein [Chloroflexi bacterium]|nr:ClbS/DfsB family four-helix bundle protein [Chloroflexota bacterium]